MLFLIVTNLMLLILMFGAGSLVKKLIKCENSSNPFLEIFLGIFGVSLVGMALSLMFPLNKQVFWAFIFLSIIGFSLNISNFRKKEFNTIFVLYFVTSLILVSLIMAYPVYPYNSDTDFYHANAVAWLREFGTVNGLANLNQRFGVNTSWHVLGAVLDHATYTNRMTWYLPCLAYLSTLGFYLWECLSNEKIWKKIYSSIIILWTFVNVLTWGFPALHFDFIPLVYNSIVVYFVLDHLLNETYKQITKSDLNIVFLMATASFMIKPMGAMSIFFVMIFILISLLKQKNLNIKNLLFVSFIPALSFMVWIIRNVKMSGWPFYPTTILPLSVEWLAPVELLHNTFNDILGWARMPLPNYQEAVSKGFWFWIKPWVKINFTSIRFWLVGILPFLIGLFCWIRLKNKNKNSFFILTWSLACFAFWFTLAPDIRFGDGFFVVFGASGLVFLSVEKDSIINKYLKFKHISYVLLLSFILFSLAILMVLYTGKRGPVNLLTIGSHGSGAVELVSIKENNDSVLKVWVPIPIDKCESKIDSRLCPSNPEVYREFPSCGNSPLPCTGYFNKNLRMLKPGNIGKGFKLIK